MKVLRGGKFFEFPPVPDKKFSWAGLKFWIAVKRWNYGTRKIQLKNWLKIKWATF